MSRRGDRDRSYRRVLALSLGAAVLAHAGLVLWNPVFDVEEVATPSPRIRLEIRFGEPELGREGPSSPGRDPTLRVELVGVPGIRELVTHWPAPYRAYSVGGSAALGLRLDGEGSVVEARIVESSGDPGKDSAFVALASSLRYRVSAGGRAPTGLSIVQGATVEPVPYAVDVPTPPR